MVDIGRDEGAKLVTTTEHDGQRWVSADDYNACYQAFRDWQKVAGDRVGQLRGAVEVAREAHEALRVALAAKDQSPRLYRGAMRAAMEKLDHVRVQ